MFFTWHVLDDLIFYGQWINLHDRSQNGPKLVTNDYLVWYLTYSSYMWIQTVLPCGKQHCQTWQHGTVSRLRFAGDLEDSNSTAGGTLCILGSHTFVPISWMCKKLTSVSHSSTETEIISLDAGLRTDGIPALTLWGWVTEVFILHHTKPTKPRTQESHGETCQQLLNHTSENEFQPRTPISIWSTLVTFHQAWHILVPMPCCMSLRTMKPWLRW